MLQTAVVNLNCAFVEAQSSEVQFSLQNSSHKNHG